MKNQDYIQSLLQIGDLNADRLEKALLFLSEFMPLSPQFFENMTFEQIAATDLLIGRFSKLQDMIGSKIFPLLLTLQEEDITHLSYLDRLHLLEKLNILKSSEDWRKMRDIRNHVTHEYPGDSDLMSKYFNQAILESQKLLHYWNFLKHKINIYLK